MRLEHVGTFDQPVHLLVAPNGELVVVQKGGTVVGFDDRRTVLDVSQDVSTAYEQGLLGAAFKGEKGYVSYTDRDGDSRIVEYAWRDGRLDPDTRRELLKVDQPFANHNGGHVTFGPDGMLYIGFGDGGGGGDPHRNGQSKATLLGKLLRIDPAPREGSAYTVPRDNPFAGLSGARPEIWAYGLRNPWRFSFDRATDDLWIGDVGQSAREEIDLAPKGSKGGANYGWNAFEGTARFEGDPPPDAVPPVHDYGRDDGACTVIGGVVYRGAALPALQGGYLFGDLCDPAVRVLVPQGDGWVASDLGIEVESLVSLAEDAGGEVFAVSISGPIYRLAPAG